MARFSFLINNRKKQPVQPPARLYSPTSKAQKILGHDASAVWDDPSYPTTARFDDTSAIITATTNPVAASYTDLGLRPGDIDDQHIVIANGDGSWGEKSHVIPNSLRLDAMFRPNSSETVPTPLAEQTRKTRSSTSSSSSSTLRSWYHKSKSPLSLSRPTSSSAMTKPFTPPHTPLGLAPLNEGIEDIPTIPIKQEHPRPHGFQTMSQKHDTADTVQHESSTTLEMDRMLTSPSALAPAFTLFPAPSRDLREPSKRVIRGNAQAPGCGTLHASADGTLRARGRNESPALLPSLHDQYDEMSMRQVVRQSSTPNLQATKDDGRLARPQNAAQGPYQDEANGAPRRSAASSCKSAEFPRTTFGLFPPRPSSSPGGRVARSVSSRRTKTSKCTQRSLQGKDLLENSVLMLSSDSEEDDDDQNMESQQASHRATTYSRSHDNRTSSASSDMGLVKLASAEIRPRTNSGSVASRRTSHCGDQAPTVASSGSSVLSDQSTTSYSAMSWQDESEYDVQEARAITMIPARRLSDLDMEVKLKSSSGPYRAPSTDQPTPPLSPSSVDFYIRSAHSSIDGLASPTTRMLILTHQEEMLISALRHKQQSRRRTCTSQIPEGNEQEKVTTTREKNEGRTCSTSTLADRSLPFAGHESADSLPSTAAPEDHGSKGFPDCQASQASHTSQARQPSTPGTIFDFSFPTPPSFRQRSKPAVAPIPILGFGDASAMVPSSPSGPPPTISLPALPKVEEARPMNRAPSRETVSAAGPSDASLFYDEDEPGPNLDDIRHWEAVTSPFYTTVPCSHEDCGHDSQEGHGPDPSFKAESPALLHPNSSCRRPRNGNNRQDMESCKPAIEKDIPRPDSPVSPDFPDPRTYTR
ncbi:hypothetical protein E4U54_002414 [Claviceps lovelessii]|nr:hypothetical protein E4U54_002414 [Claviceps lovelessii]